ncbi:flagellar basal body P-ring formation chaperone FlgA [Rhodoplanes serenus]|uniref:flagellar basal body P-ring formation chaperone FlgA n=1 Tax=Rhodoplanes serenus TaxID=200615 RepID=UPI000DADA685|nr:flagellar basal body P-ring formation chaperone FlgA [Rhodoplanes serenus]RAI35172.1 flagella basal body P-ring formation protein FlgA [Rhodoplanes serenus]
MIRLTTRASVLAAAVAAALLGPLTAAPGQATEPVLVDPRPVPMLRRAVLVSDPLVRIGDLVENAGAVAAVPVFRAPDVGTTGSVSTALVLDALRPHRLFRVEVGDITEIEVTRAGRIVTVADIQARILQAFAGQYGLGDAANLTLTVERDVRPFAVEPTSHGELVVARSSYDPRSTRFDITFEVPGSQAARRVPLRFTGTLVEMTEAVIVTRAVQRGDVLKTTDVLIERRPRHEVPIDAASPRDRVAGLAIRQNLRAGQVIRRGDLTKPDLVRRDDTVTMIYEAPGLMLTTRGKAIESGAEGDMITAVNVQSKRTVQGIVTGAGQITLVSATPRVLAAAAVESAGSVPGASGPGALKPGE